MYHHEKKIISQGVPLPQAQQALVLVHGRGATSASILSLQEYLEVETYALLAPQATNHSWYPYSFMAPVAQNQPALDSALSLLQETVQDLLDQGLESKQIYLTGFSQGACLTAEFAARNARQYGGLLLFTGGLIGATLDKSRYQGSFEGTLVLITTGDPDPHVPVSRIEETKAVLEEMGAAVTQKIYPGRPHTILPEELTLANDILKK